MSPLLLFFWGLFVVVADLRINGFDVVPDIAGWALMGVVLRWLADRDAAFWVAAAAAVVGGVGSVVVLAPGLVPTDSMVLLGVVDTAATLTLVFATCTGMMRLVAAEPPTVRRVRNVRTAYLLVALVAILTPLAVHAGVVFPTFVVPVVVATLGVLAWFLVLVWRLRNHPRLQRVEPLPAV